LHEYELVTILSPEIRDEDVAGTIDRINAFIGARGGEIQNIDQWGRRRLAYPIARQFEGTYVVTLLRLPAAQAAELEANLAISEDVLRHLLVRYSPSEAAAALAASQRRRPRARAEDQPEDALATAEPGTAAEQAPQAESAEAAAAEAQAVGASEQTVAQPATPTDETEPQATAPTEPTEFQTVPAEPEPSTAQAEQAAPIEPQQDASEAGTEAGPASEATPEPEPSGN
jgi:small subunit ribosomal protein S6